MIDLKFCKIWAPLGTEPEWIQKALADLDLGKFSLMAAFSPILNAEPTSHRFGLVRHPVDWLEKIYELLTSRVLEFYEILLKEFKELNRESLDQFIYDYTQKCPGAVGRFFGLGQYEDSIRCEDVPAALYMALDLMDSPVRRNQWVLKHPPIHVRKTKDQLSHVILKYEEEFAERYEYF